MLEEKTTEELKIELAQEIEKKKKELEFLGAFLKKMPTPHTVTENTRYALNSLSQGANSVIIVGFQYGGMDSFGSIQVQRTDLTEKWPEKVHVPNDVLAEFMSIIGIRLEQVLQSDINQLSERLLYIDDDHPF